MSDDKTERAPITRWGGGVAARLVTLSLLLVARSSPVWAQQDHDAPPLSSARLTAQVAGGTAVAPMAFFGVGYATKRIAQRLGVRDETAGRAAYVGAYTATWLSTAAVPAAIAGDGKFPAALGGSALGMLAAAGLVRVGNWRYDGDRRACGVVCWTMGALVVALPGVGSTIAYNRSRR